MRFSILYVSLRPTGQQRFLQVLVGVGPVFSFFAACDVEALGQRDTEPILSLKTNTS